MSSITKINNQFPKKKDLSGEFTKEYVNVCYFLSANTDPNKNILIGNFLNKHYSSKITPNELLTAFELYMTEALDQWLPTDKNGIIDKSTYKNIDPPLLAKVIKAYISYRFENKPKKKFKQLPKSRQSQIEAEDYTINSVVESYVKWRKTGIISSFVPQVIVNRLKNADLYVEKEITKEMLTSVNQQLKYKSNISDVRSILRAGVNMDNDRLVDKADHLRVIESIKASFEMIQFNEINLRDELDSTRIYKTEEYTGPGEQSENTID